MTKTSVHGVQAMVLAAGYGTRLWPLTLDRAKPAVPFLGRPLLAHVLDWLAQSADHAVVNTSYLEATVRAAAEGAPLGVDFSPEATPLGTAGALGLARDQGLLSPEQTTVIVNGKLYLELDLAAALAAHRASGAAVTMVLRHNPAREHFREVKVEGDRVTGFGATRVPESEHPLAFTGIHLVEPEVLAKMQARLSDTVHDVYPELIRAGRVYAHVDDRRWWEFSTCERYWALHRAAWDAGLAPEPEHASVLWPGARLEPGAHIERCVLGANVVVPPSVRLSDAVVVRRELVDEASDPAGEPRGVFWVKPLAPSLA